MINWQPKPKPHAEDWSYERFSQYSEQGYERRSELAELLVILVAGTVALLGIGFIWRKLF